MSAPLKAPFPYPGGKSRVADLIWERFGDVDNYVEPFAGTLAVLLRRPADHFRNGYRVETVNDLNHYVVNFWRAVRSDPEAVAEWADWPVIEADLHARHKWLVRSREAGEFRERMRTDPDHFDAKVAGWWVWGQCCWIGGAWCHDGFVDRNQRPSMVDNGGVLGGPTDWVQPPVLSRPLGNGGVNAADHEQRRPLISSPGSSHGIGVNGSAGLSQQIPLLRGRGPGNAGTGVTGTSQAAGRPNLADAFDIGRGVNGGAGALLKRPGLGRGNWTGPALGDGVLGIGPMANTCDARRAWLVDWMRRLADRLRLVRTCYGHWSRICDSDSTLTRLGMTGVFLDPPYPARRADTGEKSRDDALYSTDKGADLDGLRDEVLAWCRKWGQNPQIKIAVCGYEGDGYEPLVAEGWTEQAWEASGGYANQRRGGKGKAENAKRERIWFSPACIAPDRGLFD